MGNVQRHPDCPFRTALGNCDPIGGFCTSVNGTTCDGLHKVNRNKIFLKAVTLELLHKYSDAKSKIISEYASDDDDPMLDTLNEEVEEYEVLINGL